MMPSSTHSIIGVNGGLAITVSARLILRTMKNGARKNSSSQANGTNTGA
jgi:hypothetical protein